MGIASYTFELGTEFFQECEAFEDTIYPSNQEALIYAFKATRRPYQNPAGPEISRITIEPEALLVGKSLHLTALADSTRSKSSQPPNNIAAIRYSINKQSWFTDTITYFMSSLDGAFDAPIEEAFADISTAGYQLGQHMLFIEAQDSNGNWGVPTATFFSITDSIIPPTQYRTYLPFIFRN